MPLRLLPCFLALTYCCSCTDQSVDSPGEPLFVAVPGISFINAIPENDSVNILRYEYLYNGGGVGVGDFDGNGLPDLFFGGNYVSSRLYLQTAPWEFADVTETAGLLTDVWIAGINVHDVNGDGREDIYLSTLNPDGTRDVPNRLYLNEGTNGQGVPTFREAAAEFELDDTGYGTQSAWLDLENDGDLDLYVLNNAIETFNRNVAKGSDTLGKGQSIDRIYRNDGDRFTPRDVAKEGWGLGIAIQDFNADGYADVYVANDFISDDFYLLNTGDGAFTDELPYAFPHQSRNSMGVDVADLTGDGLPEVMVVDMLPDDNLRRKTMFGDVPYQGRRVERQRGYAEQYIRNTLQLANADGSYSDIAFQAGVAATDWSWTPLLADFNNDGRRDIFVSNGYPKDITNRDFIDFSDRATQFGTKDSQLRTVSEALADVDGVHQPNYFFRNDGNLNFSPVSWLPDVPSYTNGSVFVDLDRDGDLDLVTNNINEAAGVFRNRTRELFPETSHYLLLDLRGPAGNPGSLGTKVYLTVHDSLQYHEHYRQRGYLSTVDQLVHFGLGPNTRIDALEIVWPDGTVDRLTDIAADQLLVVRHRDGLSRYSYPDGNPVAFHPMPLANGPVHELPLVSDFDRSPLAVRDLSRRGPSLRPVDLEGDGVDELLYTVPGEASSLWRPTPNGGLSRIADPPRDPEDLWAGTRPETGEFGPIYRAVTDLDGDGIADTATVGSYVPITLHLSTTGTRTVLKDTEGWYYSITPVDLDGDGDQDLIAGNAGRNTPYRVDANHPLILRVDDYDGNETPDPILFAFNGETAYPVHPRNTLGRQLPGLKRRMTDFKTYGGWTLDDLPPLSPTGRELRASEFRSLYLENDGKGRFTIRPLPAEAQIAPLRAAIPFRLSTGQTAVLAVQNDYGMEELGGRLDAGTGFLLTLDADGHLEVDRNFISAPGEYSGMARLRTGGAEDLILVTGPDQPVMRLKRF